MGTNAVSNPFSDWMDRHGFNAKQVAQAIGCSRNSIARWRDNGQAPLYILLACAAFSVGLKPVQ